MTSNIVGEFLQLRPVPNTFDSGNFMFTSNVFKHAVPHRFQLTKLNKQMFASTAFTNPQFETVLKKIHSKIAHLFAVKQPHGRILY